MRLIRLHLAACLAAFAGRAATSHTQGTIEYSTLATRHDSCKIQLAQTAGGRKVAIVVDSSSSVERSDPDNRRIEAAKLLNKQLATKGAAAVAADGRTEDMLAIVSFSSTATLLSPLGPPSNATQALDSTRPSGGTFIASGVLLGTSTLAASQPDRPAALVLLTDGWDTAPAQLAAAVSAAAEEGVRVSIGFLQPPPPQEFGPRDDEAGAASEPDLLRAVLATGGLHARVHPDEAGVQKFLLLLLAHGLAGSDVAAATQAAEQWILPDATVAALLNGTDGGDGAAGSASVRYDASPGEVLRFSVRSLAGQPLYAQLSLDGAAIGRRVVGGAAGSTPGVGALAYTAPPAGGRVRLLLSGPGGGGGGAGGATATRGREDVVLVALESSAGGAGEDACTLDSAVPQAPLVGLARGNETAGTGQDLTTPTQVAVGAAGKGAVAWAERWVLVLAVGLVVSTL